MELRKASIAVLCVLAALSAAEATLSKRDKKKKSKSSNKQVHDVYIDLQASLQVCTCTVWHTYDYMYPNQFLIGLDPLHNLCTQYIKVYISSGASYKQMQIHYIRTCSNYSYLNARACKAYECVGWRTIRAWKISTLVLLFENLTLCHATENFRGRKHSWISRF